MTRPDGWSNRDARLRDNELVQNDRLDAGAALILERVTSRVTLLHKITMRGAPVPSTKLASLPPTIAR